MVEKSAVGLVGLGTMGAALALNVAEKGYRIAVFNRTVERTRAFAAGAGHLSKHVTATESLEDFVGALARPRKIILMVPAGPVVDEQIAALEPLLEEGDIVLDCGNANFHDTNRRAAAANAKPWRFLGVGVSGGEEGARHGPSIMAGGEAAAWEAVREILEAISAKHIDGAPCAVWLGKGGAGHFVKMVHNGIEYADMQMIAEIYGILRDGYGWVADEVATLFADWNDGPLRSYLVEITAKVAAAADPLGSGPLLDVILDAAEQKGTGRWTAIEAQHLGVPVPAIEAAVAARNMSSRIGERARGEAVHGHSQAGITGEPDKAELERALIAGKILCYAQGFAMLAAGSANYGWGMPLGRIARVWRAGCIIRSAMLDDMAAALEAAADNLVFDARFSAMLQESEHALRNTVLLAVRHGLPVPALGAGLSWFDQLRRSRSTANLIQGQRDFFGLHGFRRIDLEGDFHGPWAGR